MTLREVIARLKDRRVACLRCQAALTECIVALETIDDPEGHAPQLELFGQPLVVNHRPLTPPEREVWLERFLTVYPKQTRVSQAREALAVLQPSEQDMEAIWTALQWQVKQRDWLKEGGSFAPAFDRYVTGRRWMDKPPRAYLNESTVKAVAAAADFIDEAPCTTPERSGGGSPLPSKRSPSLPAKQRNLTEQS